MNAGIVGRTAGAVLALLAAVIWAPGVMAQQVNTELYGNFRYSYNRADPGEDSYWARANNASRLGVRGDVVEGDLAVFFDLQTAVAVGMDVSGSAFVPRHFFAGIRSGFGSLTVGRHSSAYKMTGLRLDPFYDSSTLTAAGALPQNGPLAGATFGLSRLTDGWVDGAVAYTSPDLMGVTLNAALYVDSDSQHDYNFGASYQNYGAEVGVQYYDANGAGNWAQAEGIRRAVRAHASYGPEPWSLGASYERIRGDNGGTQEYVYGAATLQASPRLRLAGGVGYVTSAGSVDPTTGTAVHGGIFYALFPQAHLHTLFSHLEADEGPSRRNLAAGFTYQFSMGR